MKRSPLNADPDKVRAFVDRGRASSAESLRAAGREGMKSSALRRSAPPSDEPARPVRTGRGRMIALRKGWHAVRQDTSCAVCGTTERIELHHVVPKQRLRWVANDRGFDRTALRYDSRNALPLCADCHGRHELAIRRVPRRRLRPENEAFALELGVAHWLDDIYGPREQEA